MFIDREILDYKIAPFGYLQIVRVGEKGGDKRDDRKQDQNSQDLGRRLRNPVSRLIIPIHHTKLEGDLRLCGIDKDKKGGLASGIMA